MHRKLLEEAFKKAKKEIKSERVTHLSQHLSDFIVEDSKAPYGERILRDYYNKLENSEEKIYLREHAAEALSHYLGHKSYAAFMKLSLMEDVNTASTYRNFIKKNRIILIIGLVALSAFFIYSSINKQRWMIWQNDAYIEVDFDTDKYKVRRLKVYKEERIKSFRKVLVSCETDFFNSDNSVKIWYGKNKNKELEYFTDLGLHPETGKTLKPITQYMIDKYICVD